MNSIPPKFNAAENLQGMTLSDGWKVVSRIPRGPDASGGHFSVGYLVDNTKGQQAFLKALDFSQALKNPDPARALQAMTAAFNFERDILSVCAGKKMRVATAIGEGKVTVPGGDYDVQYLVFDLAKGDIRSQQKAAFAIDMAWKLRTIYHISLGLDQLNRNGIAHLDLKPSNVLVYTEKDSRIADLGRADVKGRNCPCSPLHIAGDWAYAPPELLYQEVAPDWSRRRLGCDMYLFGSMIAFIFCGIQITAAWDFHLAPNHKWHPCQGQFRKVLPYIRNAFGKALGDVVKTIPSAIQNEMNLAISQLCDPDPLLRGHPANRLNNQYSLERYVSLFELLARKGEMGLLQF